MPNITFDYTNAYLISVSKLIMLSDNKHRETSIGSLSTNLIDKSLFNYDQEIITFVIERGSNCINVEPFRPKHYKLQSYSFGDSVFEFHLNRDDLRKYTAYLPKNFELNLKIFLQLEIVSSNARFE